MDRHLKNRKKIKTCRFCKAPLKQIGKIEPDTLIPTKHPALSTYDGIGAFIVLQAAGLWLSMPLWQNHLVLALIVVTVFGGAGAWLWQRPKKLYRCGKCGAEFAGSRLQILKY